MGDDRQRAKDEILNVRISTAKMATLKHLSQRLGVTVSSIVSSLLAWAESEPEQQQDWFADVEALRTIVRDGGFETEMVVEEITVDEWPGRELMCQRLQSIGYIDSYKAIVSKRDLTHMICSYKLTTSGRIVAMLLAGEPSPATGGDGAPDTLDLFVAEVENDVEVVDIPDVA